MKKKCNQTVIFSIQTEQYEKKLVIDEGNHFNGLAWLEAFTIGLGPNKTHLQSPPFGAIQSISLSIFCFSECWIYRYVNNHLDFNPNGIRYLKFKSSS